MGASTLGTGRDGNLGDDDPMGGESAIMAEINVTPLVDIFLLLLVIFMVTSSAITTSNIPVQLPQSKQAADSAQEATGVIVTVNANAEIYVNSVRVMGSAQLEDALKIALAKSTEKTVVLEGDREAMLGSIVEVMDVGKKAGALKFAVAAKSE
jgi:biopolymer transport protein ExbD